MKLLREWIENGDIKPEMHLKVDESLEMVVRSENDS